MLSSLPEDIETHFLSFFCQISLSKNLENPSNFDQIILRRYSDNIIKYFDTMFNTITALESYQNTYELLVNSDLNYRTNIYQNRQYREFADFHLGIDYWNLPEPNDSTGSSHSLIITDSTKLFPIVFAIFLQKKLHIQDFHSFIDSNKSPVILALAKIFKKVNKIDESISLIQKSIEIDPLYIPSYDLFSQYSSLNPQQQLELYENAINQYKNAIQNSRKNPKNLYFELSNLYLKVKNDLEFVKTLEKCIELESSDPTAYDKLSRYF